jgi:hypothetical protein
MAPAPEGPDGDGALEGLRGLDGPADEDLEFSGPGVGVADDIGGRGLPDTSLPGGVDHTTAAVGAGSIGLVLLGIAGVFKRRRNRRNYEALDD